MGTTALYTAATGLSALDTQIQVIANNLANVNTGAFKQSRVNFEDLLYEVRKQPGTQNALGDTSPAGLLVGLGVRVSNTQLDFSQGSLVSTDRMLDVSIDGPGFLKVAVFDGIGEGEAYTRAGNLFVNAEGQIVLGDSEGFILQPPIAIPQDTVTIDIKGDGRVFTSPGNGAPATEQGQLQLYRFINQEGLQNVGQNLYVETEASGTPLVGNPTEQGFGRIVQFFLEGSNVDPVRELVELIKAQRSFELNSQTIEAADQTLQVVANLKRT